MDVAFSIKTLGTILQVRSCDCSFRVKMMAANTISTNIVCNGVMSDNVISDNMMSDNIMSD